MASATRGRDGLDVNCGAAAADCGADHRATAETTAQLLYVRFTAEMPNECWQSDFTHYRLADGTDTKILGFLDDHSRLCVHLAHRRVTGPIVVGAFREAIGLDARFHVD